MYQLFLSFFNYLQMVTSSTDEKTIIDFSSRVETYRVVVNSPSSQGCSGFATNLAPTMTVGTGFFGRSSIGENIGPQHLVHWTKIAYNANEKYEVRLNNARGTYMLSVKSDLFNDDKIIIIQ